jgi:hypothetical protein
VRPPAATAPVSRLRVRSAVRNGRGRVVITGIARRSARMSVTLKATRVVGQAQSARAVADAAVPGRTVARKSSPCRQGRFTVGVSVKNLTPGIYRVELAIGQSRSIRTIRVA